MERAFTVCSHVQNHAPHPVPQKNVLGVLAPELVP